MSLGAYTASLWATVGDELGFAAALIPAVSIAQLMWHHGEGSAARARAERAGASLELLERVFAVHSPLSRPVRLPPERLLIVAGRGDRITPAGQARALARHWGEPEVVWFPGGHLLQAGRGEGFRALRRRLGALGLIAAPADGRVKPPT
jgi:pimeloyl-ACP methyl ester carboxylesterase